MSFSPPPLDCTLCPRLHAFRAKNAQLFPSYHNAPVDAFGALDATRLVVGLAPGLHGANATARPFTGDYAGDTLYAALKKYGLAKGQYDKHRDDGFMLRNVRITNAVRCVPPENKPTTAEIHTCNRFLHDEIHSMPNLKIILALGGIAHKAVLRALGYKQNHTRFKHHYRVMLDNGLHLLSSYHCSRYNTSTKRLTTNMFDAVIEDFAKP